MAVTARNAGWAVAAGKPGIPKAMLDAERDIVTFGYASGSKLDLGKVKQAEKVILGDPDIDSTAAVALTLAVTFFKGDTRPIQDAGIDILRQLPDDRGKRLVALLAKTCQADTYGRKDAIDAVNRALNGK